MAADIKAGTYTQAQIEELFGKIADQRVAAAQAEWEKKAIAAEEGQRTKLRSEFMDVFAANQGNQSKGVDDQSPKNLLGLYASAIAITVNEKKSTEAGRDIKSVLETAKKAYPSAKTFHGLLQKDLESGIPSAGGFTIPTVLSPDIIRVLYNQTILDRVGAVKIPMPNGNMRMSRMDVSSSVFWGNELPSGNNTQPTFGDASLSAKKMTAIVPVSNSLLRYNAVGIDSWISQDLQEKARIGLDVALLYGTGTGGQPLGLANVPGILTVGNYAGAFGLTTPNDMRAKLRAANVPMINPRWILHPVGEGNILDLAFSSGPFAWANEMATRQSLTGVPYITSASVQTYSSGASRDYWLIDFSEVLWGVGYDLSLEISREGSYVNGGVTYSAFQRDETLIRLVCEHDFNVKHPVSILQGEYL